MTCSTTPIWRRLIVILTGVWLSADWGIGQTAFSGPYQFNRTIANPEPGWDTPFGLSLALDDNKVLVGGLPHEARFFDLSGNFISALKDPTPNTESGFGISSSLSGNRVLVGDYTDSTKGLYIGQAHLFDAASGALLHTLDDPTPTDGDLFGYATSLSDSYMLIGDRRDSTDGFQVGQAHLFDVQSGAKLRTLHSPDGFVTSEFGTSVAIHNNYAVIGAPGALWGVGRCYLFDVASGELLRTFESPKPASSGRFGHSIAFDGERILIGAPLSEHGVVNIGQAYLFDAKSGLLLRTFDSPTAAYQEQFGVSLALDGDNALIGASRYPLGNSRVGLAHLFSTSTGNLLQTFNDPTPSYDGFFGATIAINDKYVAIGAPGQRDSDYLFTIGEAHLYRIPEPASNVAFVIGAAASLCIRCRRRVCLEQSC